MEVSNNIGRDKFKTYLEAKQLAVRTIEEYLACFDKFEPEKVNQEYVTAWIQSHNSQIPRAFLKHILHYLKLNAESRELKLLLSEIEIPEPTGRKKVRIKQFATEQEVLKIEQALSTERDRLMALVSFYGGLRISELISIKPYDFHWTTWLTDPSKVGQLTIIGKGNKQRKVFIPQRVMGRLYQWIKNEVSKKQDKDSLLFRIGVSRWEKLLGKASLQALGKKLSSHSLRRGLGTHLKEKGWALTDIAHYLGHSSIATTQLYIGSSTEKLKEKFEGVFNS